MMISHKLMDLKSNLSSCKVATHYITILVKTLKCFGEFYLNMRKEEQILGNEALKVLLSFIAKYLRVAGFPALNHTTQLRKQLQPQPD
jgi:hypothetical protein